MPKTTFCILDGNLKISHLIMLCFAFSCKEEMGRFTETRCKYCKACQHHTLNIRNKFMSTLQGN